MISCILKMRLRKNITRTDAISKQGVQEILSTTIELQIDTRCRRCRPSAAQNGPRALP